MACDEVEERAGEQGPELEISKCSEKTLEDFTQESNMTRSTREERHTAGCLCEEAGWKWEEHKGSNYKHPS